jgi:hypothetical protein
MCIKEYTAQRDDELSLQVSDEVKVMRKERGISDMINLYMNIEYLMSHLI